MLVLSGLAFGLDRPVTWCSGPHCSLIVHLHRRIHERAVLVGPQQRQQVEAEAGAQQQGRQKGARPACHDAGIRAATRLPRAPGRRRPPTSGPPAARPRAALLEARRREPGESPSHGGFDTRFDALANVPRATSRRLSNAKTPATEAYTPSCATSCRRTWRTENCRPSSRSGTRRAIAATATRGSSPPSPPRASRRAFRHAHRATPG